MHFDFSWGSNPVYKMFSDVQSSFRLIFMYVQKSECLNYKNIIFRFFVVQVPFETSYWNY